MVDCDDFFENINFKFIRIIPYKSAFYMNEKKYVQVLSKTIFDMFKINIDSVIGIISATTGVACVVCTGKGKLSAYLFGLIVYYMQLYHIKHIYMEKQC